MMKMWENNCYNISLDEALKLANQNGFGFYFNWEECRTEEGFYRVEGSVLFCVKRALIYSECSDMIWMETPTADLQEADAFAKGVHLVKPNTMLAYNLSPSFNWDAMKMNDEELENFIPNLASMGYCW
jgi:isocitrate lyase